MIVEYKGGLSSRRADMDFLELVKNRYSIRAYTPVPIEDEKLQQVLEAARMAPTGANRQAFQLIVVHTKGREAELRKIYDKDWFVQVPVIICACTITAPGQPVNEAGASLNVGIVMDHLILAATSLGLGSCWIGAFNRDEAKRILGIPEEARPVICAALGYRNENEQPRPKTRKPIDELVRYEHW
jgi:nitroreductase